MSTLEGFQRNEIGKQNPVFSQIRTTVQTSFYGNNVINIKSNREAYKLAKDSPGTIITDMLVHKPEELGLDADTRVLLFNDGLVTGRCAAARKIIGDEGVDSKKYGDLLREAIYNSRYKRMYHSEAYIGLDKDFMVKAHLLIPQGHENIMYNWLLNFQYINEHYSKMYKESKAIKGEGDIFIYSDPDWEDPNHPYGLTLFDPEHNCAALLGMRYFGEHKKGTLTLAWGIANRNGYAACHGGLKKYDLNDGSKFVAGVFGLSGSGKSTITHAKHDGKYDIKILHDDALVVSTEDGTAVALEPSYFDKTQDYPTDSPDNKYLITAQNCGATVDNEGKIVLVTEDIRNGNGRAIKSKLWAENRVDKFQEPINAIIWLMKDPVLPPVVKINDSVLASTMGATLATKRSTAERLVSKANIDELVIEPYANPFRTYPLEKDYIKFKELFNGENVDCYILNTGYFINKKIPKEITLSVIESIVEGKADFKKWGSFEDIEIFHIDEFMPNMEDETYIRSLKSSIQERINFIKSRKKVNHGKDKLPNESTEKLEKLIDELQYLMNEKQPASWEYLKKVGNL